MCRIRPLSYELESLVAVAKQFKKLSKQGFLFESVWKFLLYSELAKQCVDLIEGRPSGQVFDFEAELVEFVNSEEAILRMDFSARLDALSKRLLTTELEDAMAPSNTKTISENLHAEMIPKLLAVLSKAFKEKEKVVILIDNLDNCLLYTSPSPRDQRGSRMPSSA